MNLRTRIFIIFLVIATIFTGGYCFISAFYAPFFFADSFKFSTNLKRDPCADLSEKNPFFDSYLYKSQRSNNTREIPDNKEQLQKLIKEGWSIKHRFTGHIMPLWIQNDGTPVVPSYHKIRLYGFIPVCYHKAQSLDIRSSSSGYSYWSFIIPDFDCELAFLIIPFGSGNILFYPTGIHRNDMWKKRQKIREGKSIFTQIDIPPLNTLEPIDKPILDFMQKDIFLKRLLLKNQSVISKKAGSHKNCEPTLNNLRL